MSSWSALRRLPRTWHPPTIDRRDAVWLATILAATVLLRLPSFFEPPWHSDEGIFAAVAQRVLHGGRLYADAWESKPPFFLFLYAGLFKVFGPGILPLRFASTTSALGAEVALYFIARRLVGPRKALIAPALAGALLSVPFWEGTLALTEVFAILPTALAVLCVLVWEERVDRGRGGDAWLVTAGLLFGAAFFFRQTAAGVALVTGIWLMLRGRPRVRAGLLLGAGFGAIAAPVLAGFALFDSFDWFWDANVGFFLKYVPSGQELPFGTRPLIVLPLLVTLVCLSWLRRRAALPDWGLPAMWLSVTLAGALLTGRAYPHYMLQMFPALGLVACFVVPAAWAGTRRLGRGRSTRQAGVSSVPSAAEVPLRGSRWQALPIPGLAIGAALALTWGYVVTPMFNGNPFAMRFTRGPTYYWNFAGWALGLRSEREYDDYFDRRVALTRALTLMLDDLKARGQKAYIWGEYPWVYPLAGLQPTTRYVTSFYVLLLPYLDVNLGRSLSSEAPQFIVMLDDAKPRCHGCSDVVDRRYGNAKRALDQIIARDYRQVAVVGKAQVYRRSVDRLTPTPSSGVVLDIDPGVEP